MDLHKILTDLQYKAVGIKPDTEKLQEGYFVSFRQIGLPIRFKNFANPTSFYKEEQEVVVEGVASRDKNYEETFNLSNEKLRMDSSYSVEPSTQKVDETWRSIIYGATLDLDLLQLDDAQEKLFEEIEEKITDEMENDVSDAEMAVEDANIALIDKYTTYVMDGKKHEWQSIGKIYQKRLERARDKYRRKARKYEQYEAILNANGIDPTTMLIKRAKTRFENYSMQLGTGTTVPYTSMTPSDWYDPEVEEGWTQYNESSHHTESEKETTSKTIDGRIGFSFGIFSPKKEVGYESKDEEISVKTEGLTVEFSYLIVKVNRYWMGSAILNTRNWFLKSSSDSNKYEKNCISDGTFEQTYTNKQNLFLPSVISSLILVKDVKVSWKKDTLDTETLEKKIKGGASVSWGPLNLAKGSYGKDKKTESEEKLEESKELKMDGIQLIGYTSQIIPASPFIESK